MQIRGIEGLTADQLNFEIQRGGKFVFYQYCISVIVVTFRRSSDFYLVREGESRVGRGLPWTLLTLVLGWWGIPWGPIYSVQSLVVNLKGGKDVTAELLARLQPKAATGIGTSNPKT